MSLPARFVPPNETNFFSRKFARTNNLCYISLRFAPTHAQRVSSAFVMCRIGPHPVMSTIIPTPKPTGTQTIAFFASDGEQINLVAKVPRSAALRIAKELKAHGERRPHKNSKRIEIIEINPEQLAKWPEIDAARLQVGAVFESAIAASNFLGFDHNEVGQRLSYSRRVAALRSPGCSDRPTAIVRGVCLRYADSESQNGGAAGGI